MTTPRISDEVMLYIKAEAFIKYPPLNDFKSASRSGYVEGAQAFYLKGYADAIREVVEYLKSDEAGTLDKYENYPGCQFWAANIESKFLNGEEKK